MHGPDGPDGPDRVLGDRVVVVIVIVAVAMTRAPFFANLIPVGACGKNEPPPTRTASASSRIAYAPLPQRQSTQSPWSVNASWMPTFKPFESFRPFRPFRPFRSLGGPGDLDDLDDLTALFVLTGTVVVALALARVGISDEEENAELTSTRSRVVLGLLSVGASGLAGWRSTVLFQQCVVSCTQFEDDPTHPSRRFSNVMAVYALNVVALALLYALAAALDPHGITHTDPSSSALAVFFDSVYDITLVASGTGFGQRVPVGRFPKLVAFVCSAYLTIYMTMTVFDRILSSSTMYLHSRGHGASVGTGSRVGV